MKKTLKMPTKDMLEFAEATKTDLTMLRDEILMANGMIIVYGLIHVATLIMVLVLLVRK